MSSEDRIPQPRGNPHFVGHEAAEQALLDAWASGRLPHGWLITGPRGVGKATLACRFARFLLAQESAGGTLPRSLAVDPDLPVARRVASGGHADLRILQRELDEKRRRLRTGIAVEQVRTATEFLRLTPAEGGWRVLIVDPADDLNDHAANALLKMLEEPPPRSLILLLSHAPGALLPTLRSRCRRLALGPLGEPEMLSLIARYVPEVSEADALLLARLSSGSIGRALELAEQGGLGLYRELMALLLSLPRLDVARLHEMADRLGRSGGEGSFRTLGELLVWWLGRLIRRGAGASLPAEPIAGEGECMARLLRAGDLDRWTALWEKTIRRFERTESVHLDRKQVWVATFLDLQALANPQAGPLRSSARA